jgi:hypothetical protein
MDIKHEIRAWVRIAFLNLLLVALLGMLMRYKIAFYLPLIEQKHFLHAHSHFAFAGWITQILMTLLVYALSFQKSDFSFLKYKRLLWANLIAAYGMLLSFPFQGYGMVSISFSILSIIVSYAFAVIYWKDLNSVKTNMSSYWFKAALLFSIISSIGTFALSVMMATKTIHQNWYLAAIYFYLHFQYNGWFFFAIMGLLAGLTTNILADAKQTFVFWSFAFACIPAYILSALWLPLPEWIHVIVSIAAATQVVAWVILIVEIIKKRKRLMAVFGSATWIFTLTAIALSIKLSLQFGSTFHFLSTLAFSFRPIVIGYLHLVLLGVITLFIVAYIITQRLAHYKIQTGVAIFIIGILLNELLLMLQGISAIAYIPVPFINELLLLAAVVMFGGILLVNITANKNKLQD